MKDTLAFDVYGTLFNTSGVVTKLREWVGEQAQQFADTWRNKQLEYSFRRGLMQNYKNFAVCTRQALDYTCAFYGVQLTAAQKDELLAVYRSLPLFEDVREGLTRAQAAGYRMFAFSNGAAEAVDALLTNAGIRDFFLGVVSTDDLKSFKPNPAVYCHFLRQAGASGSDAWMISSNPFDVIGAVSAGMKAVWVRRSPKTIFDPWEIQPTITIGSLLELPDAIAKYHAGD